MGGVLDTTLCDEICQRLATGRWSIGSVSDLLLERNTQKHLLLSTKFTLPEESVSFVI
jgi:hypothetical protein